MVINTNHDQALIALERDELEGKKEFTYANVIKCLRLRRENIWITNIMTSIPDKYQFLCQGKVSADAPETKRCSGRHPQSSEMAARRFPRALHTRWYLPRTWSVWEEPSCLAEGEETKAEVHLGEICDLILICFFSFALKVNRSIESLKNRITSSLQNCFDADDIKVLVKVLKHICSNNANDDIGSKKCQIDT